jgi:hypothetical protein
MADEMNQRLIAAISARSKIAIERPLFMIAGLAHGLGGWRCGMMFQRRSTTSKAFWRANLFRSKTYSGNPDR